MKKKMPWVLCAVLAVICALTIFAYRDLNRAVEKNTITDLQQMNSSLQIAASLATKEQGSVTEEAMAAEVTRQMQTACSAARRLNKTAQHSFIYQKLRCDNLLAYLTRGAQGEESIPEWKTEIPRIAKAFRMSGDLKGLTTYSFLNDSSKLAKKIQAADKICGEYNASAMEAKEQ